MNDYANNEIKFSGCPACAYGNHEFSIPCGIAYENEKYTLSQDWVLPIEGFFILSVKRHIRRFDELSKEERNEMFDIVDKTISILRKHNICSEFDVIFEEDCGHFHIWIMPRYDWMKTLGDSITGNISAIFKYAEENFKNEETYKRIKEISELVSKEMQ